MDGMRRTCRIVTLLAAALMASAALLPSRDAAAATKGSREAAAESTPDPFSDRQAMDACIAATENPNIDAATVDPRVRDPGNRIEGQSLSGQDLSGRDFR